jgi:hypothetical protein
MTNNETLMKKTKNKKSTKKLVKKNKKVTKLKSFKKPKIKIDLVLIKSKKKKKKTKFKSKLEIKSEIKSEIQVPRSNLEEPVIKQAEISEDIEIDEDNPFKKRRRGRNKKEKIYFSKKTEEAIIEYNKEVDNIKRNEIYESKIKYSFEKLVENIFNTFKFTYFDNSPLEIQKETVSHLVSNIHKFEAGKGKAFSYFSIVAKNYLIFHNNNNYKRYNQHVDISDTPSESSVCLQTEDAHHKDVQTQEFMKLLVAYWEKNITKIFTKAKDLNIAYAVIELFRNCDRIENFNKKTLYLYIRELSNCKTQQITKIINKMKTYQNVIVKNYCNNGLI